MYTIFVVDIVESRGKLLCESTLYLNGGALYLNYMVLILVHDIVKLYEQCPAKNSNITILCKSVRLDTFFCVYSKSLLKNFHRVDLGNSICIECKNTTL